jgi:hypothetical protein
VNLRNAPLHPVQFLRCQTTVLAIDR